MPVWGLLSDLCVRNRSPCGQTVPGVPGCWPLQISTPGPGSQYPSCFTDEKADLQKAQQLKPHSEDAARPGLRGRQPDVGSAPEPTAVLPAPPCRSLLASSSGPRPHLEDVQVKSLHSPAASPGMWPFSGELEAAPASANKHNCLVA